MSQSGEAKGRPKATGELVGVRLQPDVVTRLDAVRRDMEGIPSRPEAIRRILAEWLKANPPKG